VNYRGNWGNYPYLPSGLVIANDMQNGVFILDATQAFTTTVLDPVTVTEQSEKPRFSVWPSVATSFVQWSTDEDLDYEITVIDQSGKTVVRQKKNQVDEKRVDVSHLSPGLYMITLTSAHQYKSQKFIIR
jgi:hypothetical protein